MSHETFRFNNDIFSKPQLITASAYERVAQYLESRDGETVQLAVEMNRNKPQRQEDGSVLLYGNTKVVRIDGTLTYRNMNTLCEVGTSYQGLKKQADVIAANKDIKTVVLDCSSSGGAAFGCFAAAKYFHDTVKGAGKEIITFIDEMACSAAYAWACIADEVILNPEGEAGSIGVVIRLVDQSKALDKAGIKPIYITAGADKVPFNEDGSFKEDFLAKLQKSVDTLYTKFVNHVHTYRSNMSVEAIKATDANVYEADEALKLGLVDKLMESEEFYAYLEAKAKKHQTLGYLNNDKKNTTMAQSNMNEESNVTDTTIEPITENLENVSTNSETTPGSVEVPEMSTEMAAMQAQLAEMQAQMAAMTDAKAALEAQAATLLAEKEAAQMAAFTEQAQAWASYGVDAAEFATLAMADTDSPLLAMMTSALDKANATLETMSGMSELGAAVEEPETTPVEAGTEVKNSRHAAMQSLLKKNK